MGINKSSTLLNILCIIIGQIGFYFLFFIDFKTDVNIFFLITSCDTQFPYDWLLLSTSCDGGAWCFIKTFCSEIGDWLLSLISDNDENSLQQESGNFRRQGILVILMYIAIFSTIFIVLSKNPIYALLSLISVFFSTILILLLLNVEFLALIFLIIYVGAISILFLFVIMMFNLKKLQDQKLPNNFWYTIISYIILVPKAYYTIILSINKFCLDRDSKISLALNNAYPDLTYYFEYKTNDILIFSNLLYNYFSYIFILSGMILLTAMLGSIVLALSTLEETK